MQKIKNLLLTQGIGAVGLILSYKGYTLSQNNDNANELYKKAKEEAANAGADRLKAFEAKIAAIKANENNAAKSSLFHEAATEHQNALNTYNNNPNAVNKEQLDIAKNKLDKAFEEISKSNIGSFFTDLYNNFESYIESLSPDKIVIIFNLILNGMLFTSFISVLGVLLSDSVLNKLTFLEK